jgi:hypothetical protein
MDVDVEETEVFDVIVSAGSPTLGLCFGWLGRVRR